MNRDEILQLTEEYGGVWALKHAERILHLVPQFAQGREYDEEAIWAAAYLHDWGGYAKWAVPGVEHYDRSAEVAKQFLEERNCPEPRKSIILECIAYHHGGPADRSFESKLFTDADVVDVLGAVGTLKLFSVAARDLRLAVAAVKKWRNAGVVSITTEPARKMVEERVKETDYLLERFEEESFGLY